MAEPTPRRVFVTDDLSAYERIGVDEFPDYDEIDSTSIEDSGAPDGD
jgi:hypothetical protein